MAAWYLEQVTDVAGHVVNYTYTRSNGQLYLRLDYLGQRKFPSRPQLPKPNRCGGRMANGIRRHGQPAASSVTVSAFGQVRHTVQLGYDPTFALSRLKTVQVVGRDATSTPTTTLSYAARATQAQQTGAAGGTGDWMLGQQR